MATDKRKLKAKCSYGGQTKDVLVLGTTAQTTVQAFAQLALARLKDVKDQVGEVHVDGCIVGDDDSIWEACNGSEDKIEIFFSLLPHPAQNNGPAKQNIVGNAFHGPAEIFQFKTIQFSLHLAKGRLKPEQQKEQLCTFMAQLRIDHMTPVPSLVDDDSHVWQEEQLCKGLEQALEDAHVVQADLRLEIGALWQEVKERVVMLKQGRAAFLVIEKLREVYASFLIGGLGGQDGRRALKSSFSELWISDDVKEDSFEALTGIKIGSSRMRQTQLESIWDVEGRQRVVVRGRAGVGKTTLLKGTAYNAMLDGLWKERFQAVVFISLRKVDGKHKKFSDILLREYFHDNEKQRRDVELFLDWTSDHKVLWLLDGWDEIEVESDGALGRIAFGRMASNVPDEYVKYWMIGCRQEALPKIGQDLILTVQGFTEFGVNEFVELYFKEFEKDEKKMAEKRTVKKLLQQAWFKDVCQLPLMLNIVCLVAADLVEVKRCSLKELYANVVNLFLSGFTRKEELEKSDAVKASLWNVLGDLAFQMLRPKRDSPLGELELKVDNKWRITHLSFEGSFLAYNTGKVKTLLPLDSVSCVGVTESNLFFIEASGMSLEFKAAACEDAEKWVDQIRVAQKKIDVLVPSEFLEKCCNKHDADVDDVLRCGLLKRNEKKVKEYSWVHSTFLDFMAAHYVCGDHFVGNLGLEIIALRNSSRAGSKLMGFICGFPEAIAALEVWFPKPDYGNYVSLGWIEDAGEELEKRLTKHWKKEIAGAHGEMLLGVAAEKGLVSVGEWLVGRAANVNANGDNGSALFRAISNVISGLPVLKLLWNRSRESIMKNSFQITPLHFAIQVENVKAVEFLLRNGANWRIFCNGMNALHAACKTSRGDQRMTIVDLLVKNGANKGLNVEDIDGRIPCDIALSEGDEDLCRFLQPEPCTPRILSHEDRDFDCVVTIDRVSIRFKLPTDPEKRLKLFCYAGEKSRRDFWEFIKKYDDTLTLDMSDKVFSLIDANENLMVSGEECSDWIEAIVILFFGQYKRNYGIGLKRSLGESDIPLHKLNEKESSLGVPSTDLGDSFECVARISRVEISLVLKKRYSARYDELRNKFIAFDRNGDDTIDKNEFRSFLKTVSKAKASQIFLQIDADKSERLTFVEFSDWIEAIVTLFYGVYKRRRKVLQPISK